MGSNLGYLTIGGPSYLGKKKKKKKKCLVYGNPTDPTFLGPTLNFFETSENFFLFLG